mmetsp:Transcript_66995/g.187268  ORF Transcript_66995/g.187268 Transcript_66995/m.187268 type:complete len:231 (+) Transcript_66995:278-970(+)
MDRTRVPSRAHHSDRRWHRGGRHAPHLQRRALGLPRLRPPRRGGARGRAEGEGGKRRGDLLLRPRDGPPGERLHRRTRRRRVLRERRGGCCGHPLPQHARVGIVDGPRQSSRDVGRGAGLRRRVVEARPAGRLRETLGPGGHGGRHQLRDVVGHARWQLACLRAVVALRPAARRRRRLDHRRVLGVAIGGCRVGGRIDEVSDRIPCGDARHVAVVRLRVAACGSAGPDSV